METSSLAGEHLAGVREYNAMARRAITKGFRHAAIIPGGDCRACWRGLGVFPVGGLPRLPHGRCACSNGCTCFYAAITR